jgi:hypothetical protein
MSKENKDYKAVGEYYTKKQETEFVMCHYLNQNLPLSLKRSGYFFEINCGNQYDTHDLILIRILPNREKKLITKIEYEIGDKQIEWDLELPRFPIWQALNLVTRKKYGENFSLFIKSSLTFHSLFAVDCRNNFVQNLVGKTPEVLDHSLEFETNDEFYRIYWDEVEKNLYVDNPEKKILKNNNICISENDPKWKEFYSFLYRRFINQK